MHIWGSLIIHPLTVPIADEIAHSIGMACRLVGGVYSIVLQPTVDDLVFLYKHL